MEKKIGLYSYNDKGFLRYLLLIEKDCCGFNKFCHIHKAKEHERSDPLIIRNLSISHIDRSKMIGKKKYKSKINSYDKVLRFKLASLPFRDRELINKCTFIKQIGQNEIDRITMLFMDRKKFDKLKNDNKLKLKIHKEKHQRLKYLKQTKLIKQLNNEDYSEINKEIDKITRGLGFQLPDSGKSREFRIPINKGGIRVIPGGKAGA